MYFFRADESIALSSCRICGVPFRCMYPALQCHLNHVHKMSVSAYAARFGHSAALGDPTESEMRVHRNFRNLTCPLCKGSEEVRVPGVETYYRHFCEVHKNGTSRVAFCEALGFVRSRVGMVPCRRCRFVFLDDEDLELHRIFVHVPEDERARAVAEEEELVYRPPPGKKKKQEDSKKEENPPPQEKEAKIPTPQTQHRPVPAQPTPVQAPPHPLAAQKPKSPPKMPAKQPLPPVKQEVMNSLPSMPIIEPAPAAAVAAATATRPASRGSNRAEGGGGAAAKRRQPQPRRRTAGNPTPPVTTAPAATSTAASSSWTAYNRQWQGNAAPGEPAGAATAATTAPKALPSWQGYGYGWQANPAQAVPTTTAHTYHSNTSAAADQWQGHQQQQAWQGNTAAATAAASLQRYGYERWHGRNALVTTAATATTATPTIAHSAASNGSQGGARVNNEYVR